MPKLSDANAETLPTLLHFKNVLVELIRILEVRHSTSIISLTKQLFHYVGSVNQHKFYILVPFLGNLSEVCPIQTLKISSLQSVHLSEFILVEVRDLNPL